MQRFSFIATGDNHFDEHRRADECMRIHDFITNEAHEREVDALLGAGDLYERASTARERQMAASWLKSAAANQTVVLAKGNHDRPLDCALFADLRTKHPVLVEEAAGIHYVGGAAILVVAWPNRASIAAMIGKPLSGSAIDAVAREHMRGVLCRFGEQLAQHPGPRILLMHAMADGALTSAGQPLIGSELNVPLEYIALAQADIAILAHVHKPQEWIINGMPIVYVGSPYRTAYGEIEEKSVVYAEFQWQMIDGERHLTFEWKRIPTPARQMLLLECAFEMGAANSFRDKSGGYIDADRIAETHGAEVRFAYSYHPDERAAAKRAAALLQTRMLEAGAADVKSVPRSKSASVARVAEIATAKTLREKAKLTWKARNVVLSDERRERLFGMLTQIEGDAGLRLRGCGNVRVDSIRACGVGRFEQEVFVDFAEMEPGLIAINGENGEGKSLLLGLLPGAMYREMPTHGALNHLVREDAGTGYVEARIDAGEVWTICQTVKASGGGQTLLLDEHGVEVPAVKSMKVSDYDTWADGHLPPASLFLASTFCAQKSGGIAGMGATDRKNLVLALKDCDHLEEIAKRARERDAATGKEIDRLTATIAELERRLGGAADVVTAQADEAFVAADESATTAHRDLTTARDQLREMQENADAIREARASYDRSVAARADLRGRIDAAQERLAALRGRRDGLSSLLDRAEEIRAAVARRADQRARLDTLAETIRQLEGQAYALDKAEETASGQAIEAGTKAARAREDGDAASGPVRRMLADLAERVVYNRKRIEKNQADLLDQADAIRAAAARMVEIEEREQQIARDAQVHETETQRLTGERRVLLAREVTAKDRHADAQQTIAAVREWFTGPGAAITEALGSLAVYRDAERDALASHEKTSTAVDVLRGQKDAIAAKRIGGLRGTLVVIQAGVEDARAEATAGLQVDEATDATKALPEQVEEAERALAIAAEWVKSASARTRACEGLASQAPMLDSERERGATAEKVAEIALVEIERARTALVEVDAAILVSQRAAQALQDERAQLRAGAPTELAEKAGGLDLAADRVAGYRVIIAESEAETTRLTIDLAQAEEEVHRRVTEAEEEQARAKLNADAARAEATRARTIIDSRREERETLLAESAASDLVAQEAESLAVAAVTASEVDGQIVVVQAEVDALGVELEAAVLPPEPAALPEMDGLVKSLEGIEGLAWAASKALVLAKQRLADVRETAERVQEKRGALTQAEATQADWKLWADTLGKDGLQALEVDAAGPEIAYLATEMLHTCHGPRWTIVAFDTAPQGKKGAKEGCDIIVEDSKHGRIGRIETFSPGQRAITGFAIRLAMAILSARDGGAKDPTLVLDEASADLDVKNAEAWIAMVRRAKEIINARQVLFVSHLPRLIELADAILNLKDGRVEVANA